MQQKNTLVLNWSEVQTILFRALRNENELEVEDASALEVSYDVSGLRVMWDKAPIPLPAADEQIVNQPPCMLFNEACAPILDFMGLEGIPIQWLEQFLFAMSFVVRAQERNSQIYMPEKFGHGVTGPYSQFADFHQYVLTCLDDKWPVTDTAAREAHNCISALALWVGANSFPLFSQFREEFLSKIQALLEEPCD